jgi:hypothetical protein
MTRKQTTYLAVLAIAIIGALGMFAASAFGEPGFSGVCSSCHTGSGITVTTSQTGSTATTTTYSVTVTGGSATLGWAVFNGSSKVQYGSGASGNFTVDDGNTYTVYGVNYSTATSNGVGSTTVSPTAPAPPPTQTGTDTAAPVTTSNVSQSTYAAQAVVKLTATDSQAAGDTGCWGVQYLYYKIDAGDAKDGDPADGGPTIVTALTSPAFTGACTVTIPGPATGSPAATHTITYWSQDAAGNVEASTTKTFTIAAAPTITLLGPAKGAVGATVAITGTGFTGATAVSFNGIAATSFTVVSDTQITATVPAGATSGAVKITAPGGNVTSTASFTVYPQPTLGNMSPDKGAVGATVTITGSGFTGATAVSFNGIAATSFTVVSDTQISALVPAGATSGAVKVTAPGGAVTSSSSFTVYPKPTIAGISPTSGQIGSAVIITGTGFTGATAVSFNGTGATSFTVISATLITATVPAGATSGIVTIVAPGGQVTSTAAFIVTPTTPKLTLTVGGLSGGVAKLGKSVTAKGSLSPVSLAGSKVTFTVQRKVGGAWRKVATSSLTIGASGAYSRAYKPAVKGSYRMQTTLASSATHTAAASSWCSFSVK